MLVVVIKPINLIFFNWTDQGINNQIDSFFIAYLIDDLDADES